MISFVVFSLRRAWQGFWRNAIMSIAATATMVLMLLLLAGFWILQTGLQASLDYTESKVEVVANLTDDIKTVEVQPVISELRSMAEVKAVTYVSEEEVYRGIADLNALGVGVHNPHQWNVDFNVEQTAETARVTDPNGLLNPGKLDPTYAGPRKGAIR